MRLGLHRLGLAPAVFWDLTPAELMIMAGLDAGPETVTRARFEALCAQYPDATEAARDDR